MKQIYRVKSAELDEKVSAVNGRVAIFVAINNNPTAHLGLLVSYEEEAVEEEVYVNTEHVLGLMGFEINKSKTL